MVVSAGLNGLEVGKVNRKNESQISWLTQFVANKLVATCIAHTYSPMSTLSHCKHPQTIYTQYRYVLD